MSQSPIPARFNESYDPDADYERELDRRDAAREPPIPASTRPEDEAWARAMVDRYEARSKVSEDEYRRQDWIGTLFEDERSVATDRGLGATPREGSGLLPASLLTTAQ